MTRRARVQLAGLAGLALCVAACGGAQTQGSGVGAGGIGAAGNTQARPEVADAVRSTFGQPNQLRLHGKPGSVGVSLQVVERHEAPAVFLRWVLPGGRSLEFAGAKGMRWPEGTLQLAAELLTKGTRSHPDASFAAALASSGGSIEVIALPDAMLIEGHVLSHQLLPYLRLLREALTEASLDARAIDNLKARHAADLRNDEGQAQAVAAKTANRLVYGPGHAYGSPGLTLESIGQIKRPQLVDAARLALTLGGSTLVVVGDVAPAQLGSAIESVFGTALDLSLPAVSVAAPLAPEGAACHVIDLKETVQTAIVSANPAPARHSLDWPGLAVTNQILGGSASSRLFTELRERKGLTYGIFSTFIGRRRSGQWLLETSVRTEVATQALQAIEAQLDLLRRKAPSGAELETARRYLAGQFALSMAEGSHVADLVASLSLYDLPSDTYEHHLDDIQGVSAERVQQLAQDWVGAGARSTVLAGQLSALRPGLDAMCPRLVERDPRGKALRTLLGTDAEMTDATRALAFSLWPASPEGLIALDRFVSEADRSARFRAEALAALAQSDAGNQTLVIGRKAADWPAVADALAPLLVKALRSPDVKLAAKARAVLLAMANDVGSDGKLIDLADAGAAILKGAVTDWAFDGLRGTSTPEKVREQIEARLAEGDAARLGTGAADGLEQWIAADVRRHEAARALVRLGTPEAATALIRGYRRLYGRGVLPDGDDLEILTGDPHGSLPTLLLQLDMHAMLQRSDEPATVEATALVMAKIRDTFDKLAQSRTLDETRPDLEILFDKLEAHIENLLLLRNADDRWFAARLLVRYRGVDGVRRVLAGMAVDDHYRAAAHHSVDPKRALGELARDEIAPLGAPLVQPLMLAALAAENPVGKIIAVTVLKALGDASSLAALRTHNDDLEVASYLDLAGSVTVRDLAVAAVDVRKYMQEVDAAVTAGTLSKASGMAYKELAFFTYDLTDRRLRAEVARLAAAGHVQAATPAAPETTAPAPAAAPEKAP